MLTENEKIARAKSGLENATYFKVNDNASTELEKMEAVGKYNQKVDEYVEKFDKHAAQLEEYAKQFNETVGDLEIKAIGKNIIVQPFSQNPFQKIKKDKESGLIIDLGGMAPQYKSNETGEWEEEEQFIHVGTVFDAGPDCDWVRDGDIVMWTKPSETPIPFYRQNIYMIPEQRVMCVINSGLTDRFKNIKNGR